LDCSPSNADQGVGSQRKRVVPSSTIIDPEALLLISLTGVALFALMAWLSKKALGGWHASETSHD
jgi:4-hydroxybenzoate polyprenyltransferase